MSADEHTLGRSTRTVSALTVASRTAGLVRDMLTARIFGDTLVGSAFAAAFAIPNTFRRLFGEGALSAAFLPEYTRLADDAPTDDPETGSPAPADGAGPYASLTIALLTLTTGAATVLLELALLAALLAFPHDPDRAYALRLVMVVLPFMPLVCVAAILGGMLQSHGRFAPWAAAPVLLNAVLIAAVLPFFLTARTEADVRHWGAVLCVAAVVAGALQIAWSLWCLRGLVGWTTHVRPALPRTRAMLVRMLPALLGLGTLQINGLLDTLIAMWPAWVGPTLLGHAYPLDESSNAVLFYAQRLYQFPLGVFGVAVATAAFPLLSRTANDPDRFADVVRRSLRLSLFIALPASAGLALVAPDLVRVLYTGGGGFSDAGAARATLVTLCYAGAVWAYSANHVLTRAFYATGDTTTPMRVAVAMVALNLVLNLTLIWFLREAGLALSTAIAAIVQTALLARLATRRLGVSLLSDPRFRSGVLMLVCTTLVMAAAVGLVSWLGSPLRTSWGGRLALTLAISTLGGGVYAGAAVLFRRPELGWLLGRGV